MTESTKAWLVFSAVLTAAIVIGAAGHDAWQRFTPKCQEIVVTGTPGVSRMAVEGNDLFLTGVTSVKCGEYKVPEPRQLGF